MLEAYHLREDPFPIVPDGPVDNWAGREELQEDLVDLVKGVRARDIGVTEFVILYGELGAGKSHALRYLKTMIERESRKPDGAFNSLALYVERPRVATKLNFLELHRYIIRLMGREKVHGYCQSVKALLNETTRALAAEKGMGDVRDLSSFEHAAVEKFRTNDQAMVRLLSRGSDDVKKIYDFLVGDDRCDGTEYEGKVDSDFMAAKILSDFFRVLTADLVPGKRILESVYLFVDEGEMLVEAKATESELVFNGLRELINGIPYRFGLIISFSAATALIEAIMPNHLLKRLTRQYIEVPMLTDEQAVDFLRAQINHFRPPGSVMDGTFYPFSEPAIEYIVQNRNTLTPRNLFIDCKRVLERAIRRHELQPGEEITRDMAEKILGGLR
jgi:energy-coupling factor transporter ATP-binding protein EcfA2